MVKLPAVFGERKSNPSFFAVSVGSETLKCVAFEVSAANDVSVASIVGFNNQPFPADSVRNGVIIDFETVAECLRTAVAGASSEYGKISDVVFGVSGDLSYNLMTTVKFNRSSKLPLTEKEINRIFDQMHEIAQTEALNECAQINGNSEQDLELITSSVVYTKIDGKYVRDPVGAEGRVVEIALFTAFTPSFHTKALAKVAKSLGLRIVAIGSEMYALVKSLEFSKGRGLDCVIIDVGGGVTDVGVIFGGGIVSTRTLPVGGLHFTRALSKKRGIPVMEAENKKKEYSFGKLSEEENLTVKDDFSEITQIWLDGMELLFMEFTGVKTFAPQVYVVGGGVELPDVHEYMAREPWTRSIPFKSLPEFIKLSLKDLVRVVDTTGEVRGLESILPAALSAIYLESYGYYE